jgi:hypothetical protein
LLTEKCKAGGTGRDKERQRGSTGHTAKDRGQLEAGEQGRGVAGRLAACGVRRAACGVEGDIPQLQISPTLGLAKARRPVGRWSLWERREIGIEFSLRMWSVDGLSLR